MNDTYSRSETLFIQTGLLDLDDSVDRVHAEREAWRLREKAIEYAAKAANYIHPRLTAQQVLVEQDKPPPETSVTFDVFVVKKDADKPDTD